MYKNDSDHMVILKLLIFFSFPNVDYIDILLNHLPTYQNVILSYCIMLVFPPRFSSQLTSYSYVIFVYFSVLNFFRLYLEASQVTYISEKLWKL